MGGAQCLWGARGPSSKSKLPQGPFGLPLPFPLQPQVTFTLKINGCCILPSQNLYLYSQCAVTLHTHRGRSEAFYKALWEPPFLPYIHTVCPAALDFPTLNTLFSLPLSWMLLSLIFRTDFHPFFKPRLGGSLLCEVFFVSPMWNQDLAVS